MNGKEAFGLALDRLERAFKGMHNRDQEIAQLRRDVHQLKEALADAPIGTNTCNPFAPPVRYARVNIPLTNEIVAALPIKLSNVGDAVLVWANEGDLLRAGLEVTK